MKKALLLFAALLVAGCGEKSSSEGLESASESAEPSADTPNSLSDADVERLLKEAIDIEPLEEPDDLHYQNNEPFSGWGKMMYDSGQVLVLVQLKDGKADGLSTSWYEDGQKKREATFKDGKKDGPWTMWHENGQKARELTYKDGKLDGLMTSWHENGQKEGEETYKDGEPDGLWTSWHDNEQKRNETIYKDGEVITAKWWNSKGEEVETEEESGK